MKKILLILLMAFLLVGCGGEPQEPPQQSQAGDQVEETETPEEVPGETMSQKNAVGKAELYLEAMPFSKSGLVEQLEFDGFDNADAVYAVDKITVDWKEQAALKAETYLEVMPFSKSELIEQLEFDGFSNAEATYAVDKVGF